MRRTVSESLRRNMVAWFKGASAEDLDFACQLAAEISEDPSVPEGALRSTLVARLEEMAKEHPRRSNPRHPAGQLMVWYRGAAWVAKGEPGGEEGSLAAMLAAIWGWDRETSHYYELTPRLQVAFDVTRDEPLTIAHNDDAAELGEIPLTPRAAFELQQILDAYTKQVGIAD